MKKKVTKIVGLILMFFSLTMCLTACGDSSNTSFQEQLQSQRDFEEDESVLDTSTPEPSAVSDNQKSKEELNDSGELSDDEQSADERAKNTTKNLKEKSDSDYDKILDLADSTQKSDRGLSEQLYYYYYSVYYCVKNWAPHIIVASIIIGLFIFHFAQGNKRLRGIGLFSFVIGIPVIVLVFIYGVGIFNGMIS